jgi:putative membrane protein
LKGLRVNTLAVVLVGLVAAIHGWILVLEMFLWRTPRGLAAFGLTQEQADATATMAANQGLYNGFLAAGLIWGMVAGQPLAFAVRVFFLCCVLVAGVYGAVTASRRILFVQALPAALALIAVLLAGR